MEVSDSGRKYCHRLVAQLTGDGVCLDRGYASYSFSQPMQCPRPTIVRIKGRSDAVGVPHGDSGVTYFNERVCGERCVIPVE